LWASVHELWAREKNKLRASVSSPGNHRPI
jgi:hypothetical protein